MEWRRCVHGGVAVGVAGGSSRRLWPEGAVGELAASGRSLAPDSGEEAAAAGWSTCGGG